MKKILFLIHDLGHGGAEKVLVNLVNNMDPYKFDITVMALFGGGVNEQFLKSHIHYKTVFSKTFFGNSHIMKLFTPQFLHRWFIREHYDIEIAYLEGPAVRIVSGCLATDTKLCNWIHCTMRSKEEFCVGFRSMKEALECNKEFHSTVFVSKEVKTAFERYCSDTNGKVLYNTNESEKILKMADEPLNMISGSCDEIRLIAVGKIEEVKGFDRLARVHKRLKVEGYNVHTYILGDGNKRIEIENYLNKEGITDSFTFLGYQTNPYKFIKNADVFVCSSYSEGFSTAATEALIVGKPVVTTLVSGMKEMLGANNEWGIITDNNENSLYKGIKQLLDDSELLAHYTKQAKIRGKTFSTGNTVKAVEDMFLNL